MRFGGLSEIADELGVSTQRVGTLRQRNDFPDPVGQIALGPIWDLDEVARWNGSGLRQRAGRPKSDVATRTLGGRFMLEPNPIANGGFAEVFRATDRKTGELVAVKVLRETAAADPESIARFGRELRLLEELDHPNVIAVIGHGETEDKNIWYAMPLAQGSLADFIAKIGGNDKKILDVMRQVCTGLAHVHEQGIYHRDLKPANVLRLSNGDWAVSDFGLAVEAERGSSPLTSTLRAGMGSWVYAAPEQWQRARRADHRSDIYSLGKILQELVTGEYPVNFEIPACPLRPVIEKATTNSPSGRYQSVQQFEDALERALDAHAEYQAYESAEQAAERLHDRMISPSITDADRVEMLEWAATLDERNYEEMKALTRVLPWCKPSTLTFLWQHERDTFRRVYQRFSDHLRTAAFSFEYCDVLADFSRRAVQVTKDAAILRMTVAALAVLGPYHNRWHVRDVLIAILQDVKTQDMAMAAVEGLQSVAADYVAWSITDFTIRSLPPAIRGGIEAWRATG